VIGVKGKQGSGWNVLLAISVAGILVAGWFAFYHPNPSAAKQADTSETLKGLNSETKSIESKAAIAEQRIKARTWDVGQEMFGSQILDSLTKLAEGHGLQLTSVRIGKPLTAASLKEIPLFVNVQGKFMDVMAMVAALEDPDSKIALGQLDISTSSNGDVVSATISMTGFINQEST